MGSPTAAALTPASAAKDSPTPASAARPGRNFALGYLRGFLVVLVMAHHSVLAYLGLPLPALTSLRVLPPLWRAFPVVDHQHWAGFSVFTGFNDDFFMSLMFFVSGLFVWSSLRRKGGGTFARDRMLRLGVPFVVAAAIVAPIAYYPSYLMTGAHGLTGYLRDWVSFGDWPTGPAWFIWLLLAFDIFAAALFAMIPNFGEAIGRLAANGRLHPVRLFLLLIAMSAGLFIPMLYAYGPMYWTSIGPFQFQTSRVFHYAIYFFAGIGVGAWGIERGLLAPDGFLARHWGRWVIWMVVAFAMSVAFVVSLPALARVLPSVALAMLGGTAFVADLRRVVIRVPRAVCAIRPPSLPDLRQPERQRIRDVSHPLHVRLVAAVCASCRAALGDRESVSRLCRCAAAELGHKRSNSQRTRRSARGLVVAHEW